MWAAVLENFLFASWRTAGKVILGDESTIHQYYWRHDCKYGGFFPICQHVSNKTLQFVELSQRFVSISPIMYYKKLEKFVNPSQ